MTDEMKKMLDDIHKAIKKHERHHGTVGYIWCNPKVFSQILEHDMSIGKQVIPVPELPDTEVIFSQYDLMEKT